MKMIKKTKTTVIAYVYVSNDTSSVSAWCLHRAQTMLSSAQYFCKNLLFLLRKISSILEQLYMDLHKYTIAFELAFKIFLKLLEMT